MLTENQIEVQLDDQRERGTRLKATKSPVKLRKNQQAAVRAMSKYDAGILHAPTAFGKTVAAIGMITKRKANTLILVHSRQLLDQWRERLKSFLPDTYVGIIGGELGGLFVKRWRYAHVAKNTLSDVSPSLRRALMLTA